MSRSYKKNPRNKDNAGGKKWQKRVANKKVRRYDDIIQNGKAYRKITDPWDICDFNYRVSYADYLNDYFYDPVMRRIKGFETEEDCYRQWFRYYKRK